MRKVNLWNKLLSSSSLYKHLRQKSKYTYFSSQLANLFCQHQLQDSCKQTNGSLDVFELVPDLPSPGGEGNQQSPLADQTSTPTSQQKPN
jgi:hypothetical protein